MEANKFGRFFLVEMNLEFGRNLMWQEFFFVVYVLVHHGVTLRRSEFGRNIEL